jgi:hypothetical protein
MRDWFSLRTGAGWRNTIPLGLAGVTLVLVFFNVWFVLDTQARQAEVNQRQQFINQSMQLSRLNEGLVRAIATAAVNTKDEKLRQLLSDQGINVTFTPNAAAPPASAPSSPMASGPASTAGDDLAPKK